MRNKAPESPAPATSGIWLCTRFFQDGLVAGPPHLPLPVWEQTPCQWPLDILGTSRQPGAREGRRFTINTAGEVWVVGFSQRERTGPGAQGLGRGWGFRGKRGSPTHRLLVSTVLNISTQNFYSEPPLGSF